MMYLGTALLWGFFGLLVLVLFAAALICLVLPSVVLRASCSVAEVKEPRYLVSFPLGYGVLLGYVGCIVGGGEILGGAWDANPADWLGPMHVCGYFAGLVLGWVCVSLAYRIRHGIAPSIVKGFWVAGLQLFLYALYFALVTGLVLTLLSVRQMLWSNAPSKPAATRVVPVAVDRS